MASESNEKVRTCLQDCVEELDVVRLAMACVEIVDVFGGKCQSKLAISLECNTNNKDKTYKTYRHV